MTTSTARLARTMLAGALSPEQVRERAVALWGEDKVAANEADVARRFGRNAPRRAAR